VTHAHSDHSAAISNAGKTFVTQATLDLFNISQQKRRARNIEITQFNEPFELGKFEVEFIPAGHLLGAAQILVRQGNSTFHFSGDFCPEQLLTVPAAEIPNDVDVSVMDSTYGDNRIMFSSRQETRQRLFVWAINQINADKIPVINAAHLGGAQELISLFNQLGSNLPIYVHPKIAHICQVYKEHGVDLKYIEIDLQAEQNFDDPGIILLPRAMKTLSDLPEHIQKQNTARCMVTGQSAKYGFGSYEYSAALSSHASFLELVDTAQKINPKRIFTYYGYSELFANQLDRKYGIPAMELKKCGVLNFKEELSKDVVVTKNHSKASKNADPWDGWY
jgi:putative mRNA 3-end processing factor